MKRIYNIIMCVFALLVSAEASAQLKFEANAEARQGQTATLNVVMNNSEAVRGFQFDLTLPAGLTPTVTKVGSTNHELSVSKVTDGKWRVLCYSMDNAEYPTGFGTVAKVEIPVPESLAVGSYSATADYAFLSTHTNGKVAVGDFSAKVTVLAKNVPATSVALSSASLSLMVGESGTLTATVSPENATDKTVVWTTSNASVATVDGSGKVTAVGAGEATITAACGSASATCKVSVIPDTYTLKYYVDGELYKSVSMKYGATITPIAEPTKEGYTFSGWSEIPATMPAKDVTVTGTFTVNTYTITYKVDGEVYKTETYKYGATVTPVPEPTREGKTFSGWSEIPKTMPAHDVEVVGSFNENTYKIVYIVDGATYKTEMYEYGAAITPLAEPTKEGYTFSGWSEIPKTMPAKDVTVTGTFTVNSYTITYKVDGEVYKTEKYKYGATITPLAEPTKEGYTFSGWSEIPATMPAKDVTVTGTFTVNTYTITYKVDGEVYKTETYKYGAAVTPVPEPTREGETFSGWSEIPKTMPAHDVEVVGSFNENTYKIVYIVDGATYKTEMYEYGAAITPLAEPKKEGHTFSGWSEIPATMPAKDVTVTGTFTVNTYTITYKVDGEVYKTETYKYGATITPLAEPKKEGYTFSGWSEIPATMPAKDVTVTGTFTVNKYMVRYYDGETLLAEFEVEYGAEIPAYEYNNEESIFERWDGESYETMPAHDIAYCAITTPNGIDGLKIDDGEITVYDLKGAAVYKGKRAEIPHLKGLYIVKLGGKAVKCRL